MLKKKSKDGRLGLLDIKILIIIVNFIIVL